MNTSTTMHGLVAARELGIEGDCIGAVLSGMSQQGKKMDDPEEVAAV